MSDWTTYLSVPRVAGSDLGLAQPSIQGVKGKAIPLQTWTGPEGSRRVRLPYFKTIGT